MALIKYVGAKPSRADTVAGTKIVWNGHGDVQEVPDTAVARLLLHPDVWAVAEEATPKTAKAAKTAEPADDGGDNTGKKPEGDGPQYLMQTEEGALVLDNLDKDALRKIAQESGLTIHHKKPAEFFREELAKAFPVTGEAE